LVQAVANDLQITKAQEKGGSVQEVTPLWASQRNECGKATALLFLVSYEKSGSCRPEDVASQQTATPFYAAKRLR
jgi:hypothetical protein